MNFADQHERKKAEARANGRGHILDAHARAAGHRAELKASSKAGCFYCCEVFSSTDIKDWVDNGDCALCPRCGIDSVIGDASGFPVSDPNFLKEMHEFWF
ncbi:MAG TPA: cytoplasmic protein [Sphingomonas sp.]|nr:cytoplasmic protein [Sphingomonas sp.]